MDPNVNQRCIPNRQSRLPRRPAFSNDLISCAEIAKLSQIIYYAIRDSLTGNLSEPKFNGDSNVSHLFSTRLVPIGSTDTDVKDDREISKERIKENQIIFHQTALLAEPEILF